MALRDWLGLGAQGLNWWQLSDNFGEARDAIDEGFDAGEDYVKDYSGQARTDIFDTIGNYDQSNRDLFRPYQEHGNWGLNNYRNMGEFDFQFGQDDPSYDWRYNQGLRAAMRNNAAAGNLTSGNILTDLTEYGQGMASQEYQAEFDRDLKSWDANRGYYGDAAQMGLDASTNLANNLTNLGMTKADLLTTLGTDTGQSLADLATGRGFANASIYGSQAMANAKALSSLAAGLGNEGGGGILDDIGDVVGDVWDWGKDILPGVGVDAFDNWMFGGDEPGWGSPSGGGGVGVVPGSGNGVLSMFPSAAAGPATASAVTATNGINAIGPGALKTGAEMMGAPAGWETVGAMGPEAAGTTSASTLGSTMAAASPLIAFGAIIAFDQLLSDEAPIHNTLKRMGKKEDPFAYINKLGPNTTGIVDVPAHMKANDPMHDQDLTAFQQVSGSSANAAKNFPANRGLIANLLVSQMNPAQLGEFRGHPQYDQTVSNMLAAIGSGYNYAGKVVKPGQAPDVFAGLAALYPEIAPELERVWRSQNNWHRNMDWDLSYAGDGAWYMGELDLTPPNTSGDMQTIRTHINNDSNSRLVTSLASEAGV